MDLLMHELDIEIARSLAKNVEPLLKYVFFCNKGLYTIFAKKYHNFIITCIYCLNNGNNDDISNIP